MRSSEEKDERPVRRVVTGLASKVAWRVKHRGVDGYLELAREALERREERALLDRARRGRDVCWEEADDDHTPLVTIRIPTFQRAEMLRDRALASALRQTYDHLEVLVIGDHTDQATGEMIRQLGDSRVRYVNLPRQGTYPLDPEDRWRVSGTDPMNVGLYLARGSWIAPCDDDDELTDDHVAALLGHAKKHRLEFVYGKTQRELSDGRVDYIGGEPLHWGTVTHGAAMYSMGLRFMRYSLTCWKVPEGHDWNLFRRMDRIGVRMGYLDQVVYRYRWRELEFDGG